MIEFSCITFPYVKTSTSSHEWLVNSYNKSDNAANLQSKNIYTVHYDAIWDRDKGWVEVIGVTRDITYAA